MRKASAAYDARRPSAMAWTTVAAPIRTSPVPNTPGRSVSNVTASALSRRVLASPAVPPSPARSSRAPGPGRSPAGRDRSRIVNSVPGDGSGRRRPDASGSPSRIADELDAGDLASASSVDDAGSGAAWKMARDAFLDRLVDLVRRGHVLHVAAVDEGHLGAPWRIDVREQSIEVKPPPMTTTRLPGVARVGQAEGRGPEVLEAVDDAVGVLAGDAELVRVVAADRDEDGVEALVLQVVEGEVAAEALVAHDLAAEPGDRLVLGLEDLDLRQAVLGDAVAEHPARRRVALEDGHVVAGDAAGSRRPPCRPGPEPMTGRPAAALRLRLERHRRIDALVEHRLDDLVAGVAVGVADRDRLVDLVAPAVLLARRRADPAEDARERDRPLEDPRRLAPVRPRRSAFRKPGMSMWLGHLFWQGGRQ